MTIAEYLARLDARIQELEGLLVEVALHHELDIQLNLGFIKGRLIFFDGSVLEFAEQLPVQRQRFRFHYMDAENRLICRWDSAPHYPHLRTFPFHLHTPQGVQEHPAITLLEVLDRVEEMIETGE
ncbi:MAG: hypothetical protein H5T61_10375 [Thermoflexales bacterium]|nr:hypothetical protein [Thermoflexales bacterium]